MSANGVSVYRYYNATDTACNSTLQRIDIRLSQPCTLNTTETNNATLTCTPTSEKADSAHYSTGCVIPASLTSVYSTSNDSLVVFSQFAESDVKCWASSLVGGTQYAVDTCVSAHSETGFQTFEGRQIQSEYVSANTSNGQLIRSFFANNNCTNYVSSVLFDSSLTACQSHMSANFSKTPSFKRQVYFSDEACTRPDLITYQLSNKDDCVTKSFCGVAAPFPLQETCVDTPNLPADAAEFFQNRPYAIFDNFLEPNCLGYSHSSAVPMNSCILIEGDQSTSTTFLPNGSVQDTTFNGPDCTRGINVTATYSPNGECNGVWRLTAYNYASETSAASAVSSQTSLASPMTRVMESGSGSGQLSPESNLGAILGGVAGGVVVLAAITAFLCMRYTKKQIGDKQLVLSHDNHDATADAQIPFMISSLAQDSTTNQTAHQLQTLQTANPNIQLPPTQVAPVLLPEENDAYRQLQYFSILPLPKPLGDEPIGSSKQLHDLAQQLQSSFPLGSTTSFLDNTLTSSALPPPTITTHTLQPIQIGKVSFPLDPQAWSVAEVALWIVDNGGSQDSARLVNEQDVDGCALLTATVPELADTLEIRTLGQRVRFQVGVDKLRAVAVGVATAAAAASVEVVEAPPAYFNTA